LKNNLDSDKVAVMSQRPELISPLVAKLMSVLTFSRRIIVPGPPSADEIQALEQVVKRWAQDERTEGHNIHVIIDIALRRLERELDSECRDNVMEEVRREICYRQWCSRNGL
jgi:hypothetical protein